MRSQCSHRLWRSVPHGRASGFFNCPRSGSVSEIRQFPTSAGFRMQLLHTKKEVLKPSVSSGVFCILFAAVGKKYAAGGKKHYVKKKPAGGKKRKATGNISRRRHVPYEKGPAGRKAPVGDTTQKYSSASEMLPTQKGTCHGTFLFAGHFFVSVVIRLLPCFSFAPQGRGCCWVIQWILPPPKATSRVCTPTTSRSGNISCT